MYNLTLSTYLQYLLLLFTFKSGLFVLIQPDIAKLKRLDRMLPSIGCLRYYILSISNVMVELRFTNLGQETS